MNKFYHQIRNTPKGVLVLGIFMIGFILRGPMAAVAPIASDLQNAYGIDEATVGLLSGIPVFCYAGFSPLASYLIKKVGLEKTFLLCIFVGAFAVIMRMIPWGGFPMMLTATIIMGGSVALGNISIPLIAARDFPKKFAIITGLSSATMNLGNVFAFALTVPITNFVGYRLALGSWFLLDIAVAFVWLIYYYRQKRGKSRKALRKEGVDWKKASKTAIRLDASAAMVGDSKPSKKEPQSRRVYRLPFTYGIITIFVCQCIGFFGMSAWLPSIFQSLDFDPSFAGLSASIFQVVGIFGSISVALMVKHLRFFRSFLIIGLCWVSLPFGLLFLPKFWFIWMFASGFAQGANYILLFSKINEFSRTSYETRTLSTVSQIAAYAAAGVSPTILGAIHQASHNWSVPIAVILVIMVTMFIVGCFTYFEPRRH